MEDDLKKNLKIRDNLKKNGDNLQKKKGRQPQTKK
jgi:hypothetical protein